MSIDPLVSIGIPTYNQPEGLEKTLNSITRQTYQNLEIIISDNHSPGTRTREVVSAFINYDKRIRYYRQEENLGPSLNFQFVLKESTGEFFMWAADDDDWDPTYVEKCVNALLERPNAALAYSDPYFRDYQGWNLYSYECDISSSSPSPVKRAIRLLTQDYPNTPIYGLIRTNIIKRIPLFEKYGYDQIIVLILALSGPILRIEKGLFVYGTKGISASTKKLLEHQKIDYQSRYFLQLSLLIEFIKVLIRVPVMINPIERAFLITLVIMKFILIKDKRHAIIYGIEAYIGDRLLRRS
jgi:glycosyltransferase involved in cell wall biosynthesis